MSAPNDGGPAFPLQSIGPEFSPGYCGMTLRDYFAAQALGPLVGANVGTPTRSDAAHIARIAYAYAAAMLDAREWKGQP